MPARKPALLEAPQHNFATVAGHELPKRYLQNAIEGDVLPHALLFHGPRGVGKYSTAHALAKRLNCRAGAPEGCECFVCRKISEGTFADILTVDPRGAAGLITLNGWKPGKDDPDNLQYYRFIDTRPLEGARKILIIRRADRMNIAMANYLLKLMEEPPSYLNLVLITERRSELLITIRSRCAPVKFSPVSLPELRPLAATALGSSASEGEIDALARLAEGRPGVLVENADDGALKQRAETARLMGLFQQYGFLALFRVASEMQKNSGPGKASGLSQDANEKVFSQLLTWFRDAAVTKSAGPEVANKIIIHREVMQELQAFAGQATHEGLLKAAGCLPEYQPLGQRQMDKNYLLESLLLKLGKAMRP